MHSVSSIVALCAGFLPLRQGLRDQANIAFELDRDSYEETADSSAKPLDVITDSMKSKVEADLTFVIDGSGSMMRDEWKESLDFVAAVASRFQLAPGSSSAVVVQFSRDASVYCSGGASRSNKEFAACAKGIRQKAREGRGDLGLRKALDLVGKNCAGASPPKQLVIFMGDGDVSLTKEQKADAVAAAKELEALSCAPRVFSLAVGDSANEEELKQLVSIENGEQFFYTTDSFAALQNLVAPLMLVVDSLLEEAPSIEKNDWEMMVAVMGGKVGKFQCGNLCVDEAYYGLFDLTGNQIRAGFFQAKERWELVMTLGKLIEYSTDEQVLPLFIAGAVRIMQEMLAQGLSSKPVEEWMTALLKRTESEFAMEFGGMLSEVARALNVTEAFVVVAEYESMRKLSLLKNTDLGGGELDALRTQISGRMVKFTLEAQRFEARMPLVEPKWFQRFWTAWQNAWGTVRVYVKVTTQCSVVVPPKFHHHERTTFRTNTSYQAYWGTCRSATPFPSFQWPSAIAACARRDEHDEDDSVPGNVHDNDRMIRYLGCGEKGRMKNVEPPVVYGPRTLCRSGLVNCDYNSNLCPPGSTSSGKCRLYGPFWSIYAAKMDHIFGLKNGLEAGRDDTETEACHLDLNAKAPNHTRAKCGPPQVEAFKAMINEGTNSYIYGALPALPVSLAEQYKYHWKAKGWGDSPYGVEGHMSWPLPHQRVRDPPLGHVLREVQRGSTIVMLAYGFSGAGKTSTLVGSADNAIDGALSLFLEQYGRFIQDIEMRVLEVYGRLSPVDGTFVPGTGNGIWGFKIKASGTKMGFIGDWKSFHTDGKMDFQKLEKKLDAYRVSLRRDVFRNARKRQFKWANKILKVLAEVEDERRRQTSAEEGMRAAGAKMADPMAHIRGTPNNPSSSRGTLYCLFDFIFKHGGRGTVAIIDLAGSEDPVTMVSSFAEFIDPAPADKAYTEEARAQRTRALQLCPPGEPNDKLVRSNLHRLADYNFLDHDLAECVQFRDFLVECSGPKDEMPPSCARVMLHGKEIYLQPNLEKEVSFVRKSGREPGSFRPFSFTYGGIEFGPVPAETVLASLHGDDETLDSENFESRKWKDWPKALEKDCSKKCDFQAPKGAFPCSRVRLSVGGEVREVYADLQLEATDRDLLSGKPTGIDWRLKRCVDPGSASMLEEESTVDDELHEQGEAYAEASAMAERPRRTRGGRSAQSKKGQSKKGRGGSGTTPARRSLSCKRENDPFGHDAPGEAPQLGSRGCNWPARVWQSDPVRGRWTIEDQLLLQGKGKTKYAKQELGTVREEFWRAVKDYVQEYKLAEAKIRYDWDKHVAYFSQVIGPMVEEALYINEMLNQMKNFITSVSFWGQNEELVPWPVGSPGNFGEPLAATQTVNMSDPSYGGYSKEKLVRPAGQARSFYDEINTDGRDPILGISLFELIRRGSLKTSNTSDNYRVLFGSFVRTDRPNGDPDCSGAQQSLEFAQYVLEAVGTHREDKIKALTCSTKP